MNRQLVIPLLKIIASALLAVVAILSAVLFIQDLLHEPRPMSMTPHTKGWVLRYIYLFTIVSVVGLLAINYPWLRRVRAAGGVDPRLAVWNMFAVTYSKMVEWFWGEEASEFPPLTPEEIEANRELVMSEPMLALRATRAELSDEAMADIADYIRFVHEREERRKRERQAES